MRLFQSSRTCWIRLTGMVSAILVNYPLALIFLLRLQPGQIEKIRNNVDLVFSEACYGANIC